MLTSNPLMPADCPYNREQEAKMSTLYSTLPQDMMLGTNGSSGQRSRSVMGEARRTTHKMELKRASTPEREGQKFMSMSHFLTVNSNNTAKYLNDPQFAAALARVVRRTKQLDVESGVPSRR